MVMEVAIQQINIHTISGCMYSMLVLVKQDCSIVLIEKIFKTFLCWTSVWRLPSVQVKLKIKFIYDGGLEVTYLGV